MTTLKVDHLSKRFHKKLVLNNISVQFKTPGIYGLLGRNGAGKSTLLNLITNRLFSETGTIKIDDQDVKENPQALSQIFLMNGDDLYPDTIKIKKLFNLSEKIYGSFDHNLAQRLIKRFKLDVNKKLKALSTGYKQIVEIIIAFCIPVEFVLLDEPISGLDANNRSIFYEEMIQTYIDRPRCFVISTHLIGEIEQMLNQIVMINNHKVIINSDADVVRNNCHTVSGPKEDVDKYVDGLNVIGEERLGNTITKYVYGKLDNDKILPDTVHLGSMSIQKMFIETTKGEEADE